MQRYVTRCAAELQIRRAGWVRGWWVGDMWGLWWWVVVGGGDSVAAAAIAAATDAISAAPSLPLHLV